MYQGDIMEGRQQAARSIVQEFLQSGVELPFSSSIGQQLLSLSSMPVEEVDVDKLVRLIEVDPGLTGKVLQLANSVYFSGVHQISNLRRAVVQIGMEEAISFIHAVYYRKALPEFPNFEGFFNDKDYWSHSWACATANKLLGHPAITSQILAGELYITGLLHGIGKLVLALLKPELYLQSLQLASEFQQRDFAAQMDIFGTTDADIGSELLREWKLPENICMAIKHYQSPENAPAESREIASLTQLAYYLANTSGVGNMKDDFCYDLTQTWLLRQSDTPLAKLIQDRFVHEIYSVLIRKSTSIKAFGGEDEGLDDNPVHGNNEPEIIIRKKKSFWQRIYDFFLH